MATFSNRFPRAVHVLPLHALRAICDDQALLGKTHLAQRTTSAVRRTTSNVDAVLGLSDYVHFYLLKSGIAWEQIPILATQLLSAPQPPFPHVALEISTTLLRDEDCTLCLWNIAVSRPQVAGLYKGGNWTRGTAPSRISEVWRAFRSTNPSTDAARGYWNEPIQVPTLRGSQVARHLSLLSRAASGIPELLLRSPVPLNQHFTLWTFADEDMELVRQLGPRLGAVRLKHHAMSEYESMTISQQTVRRRIEAYFLDQGPFPADFDFDAKRSVRT